MRRIDGTALLMALTVLACDGRCSAVVELRGSHLVENRFETEFFVAHDAGPELAAWVFFEYSILFVDDAGTRLEERGVFRRQVRGRGETVLEEDLSLVDPRRIESVAVHDVRCSLSRSPP